MVIHDDTHPRPADEGESTPEARLSSEPAAALHEQVPVPPRTTVALEWRPSAGSFTDNRLIPGFGTRYEASVPASIAELQPRIPHGLAVGLEDAVAALRDFDERAGAEVAGFAALLLRSEALSSSQIEEVHANARQVLAAEIGESTRATAVRIAAAASAAVLAVEGDGPVDAELAKRIHAALLAGQPQLHPGEFRQVPIWIGTSSASPHGAEFVAPPHDLVAELMADWAAFCARRDLEPLTQSMIGHAQFETIHPFDDGNGRTGRALLQAQLRRRGVTRRTVVPVSGGLLADTGAYFDALNAYRAGDAAPLLRATVDATHRSLGNAERLVGEVREIRAKQRERVRARRDSRVWEVLDFVAERPVFTGRVVSERLGIPPSNLQRHLDRLVESGVLRTSASAHRGGGRVYRSDDILAAIDRFSARAVRAAAS